MQNTFVFKTWTVKIKNFRFFSFHLNVPILVSLKLNKCDICDTFWLAYFLQSVKYSTQFDTVKFVLEYALNHKSLYF
jgi:hypothetical protein